ncbi:MAG: Mitochondrial presequence protease [Candelina submexicana]|nr:MAG: Mitochondrial presequence protease [Candelina submexicana]KAI9781586.1 MAG: Mitochondrial presequence protease [Candelina submexicana]
MLRIAQCRSLQKCSRSCWIHSRAKRRYASITNPSSGFLKVGEELHGFKLKRSEDVPELELTALLFQHVKTDAEYLHVARNDQNNVFSIGFKTNPPDATGVPHILEHTTLCGSEKYPIRDPFFKMLPRSLSNFMNAFTSSDHTTYPYATTNTQDFYNLMSVYLDATLCPLLKSNDFLQEGWRIGPQNPSLEANKADDKLVFKGVVYNEMKGSMSDASYLYYIRFREQIFPALNNSGGDPQKMTDLTYQQLKKFHADHYRPTNAKILTYGNMDVQQHLQAIGNQLESFHKTHSDTKVKLPISLDEGSQSITVRGPMDPIVDKHMQYKTSTSWLMGDTSDIVETFSLSVMSSLLLDGYGSPLYKSLIAAGLGSDWSPNTGFDTSALRGIFSIGLNGVKQADVAKVKEAIAQTFTAFHKSSFDKIKVDGVLHQLELGLKHKTAQFGINLMQRLQPGWFHGVDPFKALAWDKTVSAFKANYAKKGYLEGLIEKYLLNEPTLTFTMEPSATYGEELVKEEATRLENKIAHAVRNAGSKEKARAQFKETELALLEEQQGASNQDLSCLPTVHVKDIPRQKDKKTVCDTAFGDVKVQWREASTNGLTYFRAVNTFEYLPDSLRPLIPLFTEAIMRLGTKTMSMETLENVIKLKTGGIGASYHASRCPRGGRPCAEGLSFSGYALDSNVPAMFELLQTIILETNFEGPEAESMIRELLQSASSGAINCVAESGHSYARRFAESGLSELGQLNEEVSGLTQVRITASLAARPPSEGLEDVISKLKSIQMLAISRSDLMRVAMTCGSESTSINEANLQAFLDKLRRDKIHTLCRGPLEAERRNNTFIDLPFQVYYSAFALPTVPYAHPSSAALQILSQLLTHKHLHHEIREKGGAYGGGAYARGLGGVFGFYSYRDPNPQNTMKIVHNVGRWAVEKEWTDRDIEEAKLALFQSLDAPESVSEEGLARFLNRVDEDLEQTKREQLLDVRKSDVRDVAQEYLVEGRKMGSWAVLGPKKHWVSEEGGWDIQGLGIA